MLEKHLEKKFIQAVREIGGIALKLPPAGTTGWPDRLAILPNGRHAFIELKAPGQKPRPLQTHRHETLRRLGHTVYIIDNEQSLRKVIDEIRPT